MNSLQEELVRLKAELAQSQEEKPEAEIEPEEEIEEEEPKEEEKLQEEKEEIKEEQKEPEEKLDNAGYARLRREAAAEKRRAEQLEKELAEFKKAKEADVPFEWEEAPLPPQVQNLIQREQFNQATREFEILENKVKQQYPEYGAIASEYANAMYQSIRLQNPRKSDIELNEMTKNAIIMQAADLARQGYENPVEELFHTAKELGYTGKSLQKEEAPQKEEKLTPDLKKVADNRKRSTGMTANNGRSEGLMTLSHAATQLTAAEWGRLPKAEKARLMYGQ